MTQPLTDEQTEAAESKARDAATPATSKTERLADLADLDGYERRRRKTQSDIIDAARILIKAQGTDFSMRNLAQQAGVSPATPFNHFDTKVGVLAAVVDRSLGDIARTFNGPDSKTPPVDAIIAYVDHVTSYYADNRDLFAPTLGALLGFASLDNPIVSRATTMWRSGLELIEARGELDPNLDVELLARHLESSWIGSLLPWCSGAITGAEWRRQVRFSTALALTASTTGDSRRRAQLVVADF